jgi:hypothetical protein
MVVKQLEHLTEEDRALVLQTPALIAVLISGADSDYSNKEEAQAFKAVHFRSLEGDDLLIDYFKTIDLNFASAVAHIKQKYDGDAETRTAAIVAELEKLNKVLPKMDRIYAHSILKSWRSLATSIAKAEGGILGFASISYAESQLVDLEMITFAQ